MTASAQTTVSICHFMYLLAIACALWAHGASAQTIQRCTELTNERTAAITAEDWPSLEKLAKRYIQSCHGVTGALTTSIAYEDIAMANLAMYRAQDALAAANSCVTIYYANPGCHFYKVRALLALDRLSEARDLLSITERLVHNALTQNARDLRTAYHPSEREIYLADKQKSLLLDSGVVTCEDGVH